MAEKPKRKIITIPGIGEVDATGKTDAEIQAILEQAKDPQILAEAQRRMAEELGASPEEFERMKQTFTPNVTPSESILTPRGRTALRAGIPAAGQLAGMALGGRVGFPLAGETIGGVAGEGLVQATGLAEPSIEQLLLQAGLPAGMKGVTTGLGAAGKAILKRLPGAGAGLAPEVIATARGMLSRLGPIENSEQIFAGIPGDIPLSNKGLVSALTKISEDPSLVPGASGKAMAKSMLKKLTREVETASGKKIKELRPEITINELRTTIRDLNQLLASRSEKATVARGAVKEIERGLLSDLDDAVAAGGVGAAMLKGARTRFARSASLSRIHGMLEESIEKHAEPFTGKEIEALSLTKLLNKLTKAGSKEVDLIKNGIGNTAYNGMVGLLKTLEKFPRISGGAQSSRIALGVTGAMAERAFSPESSGGFFGFAVGSAVAPEVFAILLTSPTGQQLLKRLFVSPKGPVPLSAALRVATTLARGLLAEEQTGKVQ